MFSRSKYPAAERKQIRDALTAEITEDVHAAIDEIFAEAPVVLPQNVTEQIKQSVLEHAGWVLDALSLNELQSKVARQIFQMNAISETRSLINLQIAKDRRQSLTS